jgi:peptidyl-prolyl cis-trans isomerase SurA
LLGLLLAVLLAAATACGGSGSQGEADTGASEQGQGAKSDPSAPGSDLGSVPSVVAEVNGQEIPKSDFVEAYQAQSQQAAMQAQSGQQVDDKQLRKQVVQGLVSNELLLQEADKRNITPSDRQIDRTLQELAAQNGLKSSEALVAALEKQGMDRKEISSQAAMQTKLNQLVAEETGDVSATEQEVRAMYAQLKAQQQAGGQGGQALPPFEQVRSRLEDQVESQKESEAAGVLLDKLRKKADIVIHV